MSPFVLPPSVCPLGLDLTCILGYHETDVGEGQLKGKTRDYSRSFLLCHLVRSPSFDFIL